MTITGRGEAGTLVKDTVVGTVKGAVAGTIVGAKEVGVGATEAIKETAAAVIQSTRDVGGEVGSATKSAIIGTLQGTKETGARRFSLFPVRRKAASQAALQRLHGICTRLKLEIPKLILSTSEGSKWGHR